MGRTEIKKNNTGKGGKGKSLAALKKRKQFYGGGGTYKPNFKKPTATPQTNRGHESDAFGNIDGVGMPINVPFGGGGSSGLIGNYGSMEDMRARLPPEVMANLKAKGEKFSKMTPAEMRQVNTDSVAKRKQDEKNAAAAEVARESAERLKSYNANKAYKEKRDAKAPSDDSHNDMMATFGNNPPVMLDEAGGDGSYNDLNNIIAPLNPQNPNRQDENKGLTLEDDPRYTPQPINKLAEPFRDKIDPWRVESGEPRALQEEHGGASFNFSPNMATASRAATAASAAPAARAATASPRAATSTGVPKADVQRIDTAATRFDRDAYVARYPDIQDAIAREKAAGRVFDVENHWRTAGRGEGRDRGALTTVTGDKDIQKIAAPADVTANTVTAASGTTVTGPAAQGEKADDITGNTYESTPVQDLDAAEAAQGDVTREGEVTEATLTERAKAGALTAEEIEAAQAQEAAQRPDTKDYATAARDDGAPITVEDVDGPSVDTRTAETMSEQEKQDLLGIVTTEGVELEDIPEFKLAKERKAQVGAAKTKVANELGDAPSVDLEGRQAITGTAPKGDASQIGGIPTAAAAAMSAVTGSERMAGAADMMAVVAKIPADITAAISEDPATVAAQLDSGADPTTIAAVAALPVEALVSTQMENLLAGMEEGKTPVWARPAVSQVEQLMASRGLSASTVGRDALFNAIIQSALPMAQSNAQALQQRAQQNLSNEQQANMSTAQNTMQIRMQNLANQQTAASQSADMAQQIKVQQGSFNQQAVMTSAQQKQETNLANAQMAQQRAQQESAQKQQVAISNLGAGVQSDLANLQYLNATASQNMTADQQSKLASYNAQIARTMRQADLEQDMEKANLAGELQVELSNLTEENAASRDTMSAENQERLTNLNTLVDFKKTNAALAQQMDLANLNNEQQMELANLSERAATDSANMTEANRMKLQELTIYTNMMAKNEDLRQGAEMAQLSASEKVQLANLTFKNQADAQSMSATNNAELQVYERKMAAGQVNAQLAQQMGLANLSNEQSATMFNAQIDANMDMKQFDANQQIALSNSQFVKTFSLKNLDNRQQAAMQNATALASMDISNADALTKVSVENAKNFLAMDMANLSNSQQTVVLDQQLKQQQYLSEAAASNASKQFNATSQNQTDQFMIGVGQQMEQFNTAQANAMTQSNVSEQNRMTALREGNTLDADKFTAQIALQAKTYNAEMDFKAEQWNAANAQAVEQSNITWRRGANTAATAAQNAANQQSASFEFNMNTAAQANMWQELRQTAQNLFATTETERDRIVNVINAALQNEALMTDSKLSTQRNRIFALLNTVTDSGKAFTETPDNGDNNPGRG